MKHREIFPALCKESSCLAEAIYEFTDAKTEVSITDKDGSSATSVETIVIGHACELHFKEVEKMLKDIYEEEKV